MAINEITDYTAVVTPATTDKFICQQRGTTKQITAADMFDVINYFNNVSSDDLYTVDTFLGTQSGSAVKITILQLITYMKTKSYACIYGGYDQYGVTQDCDAYHVSTNTWANQTSMSTAARFELAASTISGKGYIYGGYAAANSILCDQYNLSGDAWTSKTDLISARAFLAASTINGYGYIYGGQGTSVLDDCDEYDATGNSWTNKADMPDYGRIQHAASTILDKGYTYGGYAGAALQDCNEYNPSTNAWANKASFTSIAKYWLAASSMHDKGYIYCGYNSGSYGHCDLFNSVTNTWTSRRANSISRYGIAASSILNKGYIYGGLGGDGSYMRTCDQFKPSANYWYNKADIPTNARYGMAASTIYV